jgi:hypothetical protein
MLSMKYRKRIYYTEADKALMWDRWQKGDTLHEIARLFDRHLSSVRGILERTGGIRCSASLGGIFTVYKSSQQMNI